MLCAIFCFATVKLVGNSTSKFYNSIADKLTWTARQPDDVAHCRFKPPNCRPERNILLLVLADKTMSKRDKQKEKDKEREKEREKEKEREAEKEKEREAEKEKLSSSAGAVRRSAKGVKRKAELEGSPRKAKFKKVPKKSFAECQERVSKGGWTGACHSLTFIGEPAEYTLDICAKKGCGQGLVSAVLC